MWFSSWRGPWGSSSSLEAQPIYIHIQKEGFKSAHMIISPKKKKRNWPLVFVTWPYPHERANREPFPYYRVWFNQKKKEESDKFVWLLFFIWWCDGSSKQCRCAWEEMETRGWGSEFKRSYGDKELSHKNHTATIVFSYCGLSIKSRSIVATNLSGFSFFHQPGLGGNGIKVNAR